MAIFVSPPLSFLLVKRKSLVLWSILRMMTSLNYVYVKDQLGLNKKANKSDDLRHHITVSVYVSHFIGHDGVIIDIQTNHRK